MPQGNYTQKNLQNIHKRKIKKESKRISTHKKNQQNTREVNKRGKDKRTTRLSENN